MMPSKPLPDRPAPLSSKLAALARRFWPLAPLGLIAVMTLAPLVGTYSTKMDLLSQFLIQAAVATVAALLLFVVLRRWLASAMALMALVLQLSVLQPSAFPARAGDEVERTVDVLFANVWGYNQRLPAMARAIIALDPEIVVLAEIDDRNRSLLADLAVAYPYRADCLSHWACDSVILSRLPILDDLSGWQGRRRIAMSAARIETGFGPLVVAGAHLDQPLPPKRLREQERQVAGLIEMLDPVEDPLLLVGDFNSAPWGRLLRGLAAGTGLEIAWGLEGTWPSILPWPLRIPIDHALTGRGLELVERTVLRLPGSDHRSLHLRIGPSRADSV
jgi:endonuclease/exonuclease/phosphatase (EEP) superfamily protein YafD